MQNTGVEYSLDVTPIERGTTSWVMHTTFSNVASQVTSLSVPCFNAGAYFSVRYGAAYICKGLSATTVQADNGHLANGKRYAQNFESAPKYTVGWSNEFKMGPFRAFALIDWRQGGYAVNLTALYFDPTELLADTLKSINRLNGWLNGYATYLQPAGFVKFRELTLTYALPRSLTQSWGASTNNVRLSLSGRNLWTWSKYGGYDPEVSNFSDQNVGRFQDVTPYPPSRSVFFSILANF